MTSPQNIPTLQNELIEDSRNGVAEPSDFAVDPSIRYPSYMSFDQFIDVERLRSLDDYITEKLRQRLDDQDLLVFFGTGEAF